MFNTQHLHTVETRFLEIAYFDVGPHDAPAVFMLHGWPDDPMTWRTAAEALVEAGWRVLAPYLRGSGPTTFRQQSQRRTGDLVALGMDVLQLADALDIRSFAVVGHDWGARAAYIAACLEPHRVTHVVALSVGWGTNSPDQKLSLVQSQNYWYQWLLALDRGADILRHDKHAFTRHIVDLWSVGARMPAARFEELFQSFSNPDWCDVVLHSYRVRWGLAAPDPDYEQASARMAANPVIRVPTLTLHGGADPCNDPCTSEGKEALFAGYYRREVLPGVGHFPQWEAPEQCVTSILAHLSRRFRSVDHVGNRGDLRLADPSEK